VKPVTNARFILGGAAAILGLVAAFLNFWSGAQTKSEQKLVHASYRRIWEEIKNSRWQNIAEIAVVYYANAANALRMISFSFIDLLPDVVIILIIPTILGVGLWINAALPSPVVRLPHSATVALFVSGCWVSYSLLKYDDNQTRGWFAWVFVFPLSMFSIYLWVELLFRLPIGVVTVISLLLAPLCEMAFLFGLGGAFLAIALAFVYPPELSDRISEIVGWLSFSFGVSMFLTALAVCIGHVFNPSAWVPQTRQMFVSNFVFDGLGIFVTGHLLMKSVGHEKRLAVPSAVVASLIVALVFAFCSLYLGLIFSPHALALRGLGFVCIGRSPDGSSWDFGPYFWAMHTTFLPIALGLCAIVICWLAKWSLVIPTTWFFGRAQLDDINALGLTARLVSLIASVLGIVAFVFAVFRN